jgi:hypothetical protein
MYALPELHLFTADTTSEWLERCAGATFEMDHGLVRTVAELVYGEQTEAAAIRARGWLQRRGHLTTGLLLEKIIDRVAPRVAVEKSPSTAHSAGTLQRAFELFPGARFVQLVSHPRLYCDTVIETLGAATTTSELPPTHWLVQLAGGSGGEPDPQLAWLEANRRIADFLRGVPMEQHRLVRGEDLLGGGRAALVRLAAWLGLRTDADALDQMRHPERSPFAQLGPPSAAFGNDRFLRRGPLVRAEWLRPRTLDGPLGWRSDRAGFAPQVRGLAGDLGYT